MRETAKPATDSYVPAYARPTATRAAYEKSRDPAVEMIGDLRTKGSILRATLEEHEKSLREERSADPERFVPISVRADRAAKLLRGKTRPMGSEEEVRTVQVKQVSLQPVRADENVALRRAQMEMRAETMRAMGSQASVLSGSAAAAGGGGGGGGGGLGGVSGTGLPGLEGGASVLSAGPLSEVGAAGATGALEATAFTGEWALQVLGQAVQNGVRGGELTRRMDPGKPAVFAFLEALAVTPAFPDAAAAPALRAIGASADALARACIASPRGFQHVLTLLNPMLTGLPSSATTFAAATDAYVALGAAMAQLEERTAQTQFIDLAFPALVPLLPRQPSKRHAVLRILYAFSGGSSAARVGAIGALQDRLGRETDVFLHCVAILAFLEPSMDDTLLDLYAYYATIGASAASPSLRAASVAVGSVLAEHDPALLARLLPRWLALREDDWWEVKAQLLIVASEALARLSRPAADPETDAGLRAALEILEDLLSSDHGSAVLRVGVAYATRALARHPSLLPRYVDAILDLPNDARERLLDPSGPRDELPIVGASGSTYRLPNLPEHWPATEVGATVVAQVQRDRPESLEVGHFHLLLALLRPVPRGGGGAGGAGGSSSSSGSAGAGEWQIPAGMERLVFLPLQDHVIVGICDPRTSALALEVLRTVLFFGETRERVLATETFQGSLVLLHRPLSGAPSPECQANVAELLDMVADHGAPFTEAVHHALARFKTAHPGALDTSPLGRVASKLHV